MKRLLFLAALAVLIAGNVQAQTVEEMQAEKAAKEAELNALQPQLDELAAKTEALKADIEGLTDKLTPYPRWNKGLLGNFGVNFSSFSNWLPKDKSNTTAVNIGLTSNAFVNGDFEKAFWRNGTNLTLGWLMFDDKSSPDDDNDFQVAADAFNITSLFGYKLSEKLAVSTLGEYRTSVLDGRFNNPGYLDLGLGATWTPITDLVVVVHPLNYNFVFADDVDGFEYESSLGAKVVADYTKALVKNVVWKSNLSAFLSYEGSDLSNYTWVNSFSTAVKGVGIGLDIGLRSNKQEALARGREDNPLQSYWLLGLSYAISSK
jgi:opacity protein-like surface antigen